MIPRKLPPLPPIRDLIRVYGLSADQKFSQNFILDKNVTDTIAQHAKISVKDDLIVEVGPGPGLLTRSILDAGARRVVVQLSEASDQRLKFIMGDMLELDHAEIFKTALWPAMDTNNSTIRLLGNLPFGVASPLLIQWLKMMSLRQGIFHANNKVSMTLMFQKEVAERIVAPPNHPQRSRLSVMAQALCDVKMAYKLSAGVFVPKPKVDAAVVHFEKKAEPLMPGTSKGSLDKLEDVARFYFNKRRKTMGHNTNRMAKAAPELRPILDEWIAEGGWDMNMRTQEVSTEQFCALARRLDRKQIKIPLT
ncbi:S-adenosyl-L-methionine-dependent methyltransferase [Linnemannia elongata AG-77]|uniref:rRNA adenine N(6)-methyltransferase n=1 Tax=Linnemannia elongata AG-77 TaxID=1314771 RepID=A0A197JJ80_9FUNG|nr:S-adenosyl-L-methionine-dependent methyltransferase [Linnemannia elongata AG-77]